MKNKIIDRFDRISFHDSNIEKIERLESEIIIDFDWAKISDYYEINEKNGIILGKCRFSLLGVSHQKYRLFIDSDKNWVESENVKGFDTSFKEIGTNEIQNKTTYVFSGAFTPKQDYYWSEWIIQFESMKFEWDTHITYNEWKQGKLP